MSDKKNLFFKDEILKSFKNKIKRTDFKILNFNAIESQIFAPYGSLVSTSTTIGTRKTARGGDSYLAKKSSKKQKSTISRSTIRKNEIKYDKGIREKQLMRKLTELKKKTRYNKYYLVNLLAENVCKGEIDKQYGINAVKSGITDNNFDIAILTDNQIYTRETIQEKMDSIYGIIIVQKGECKLFPDIYAINLICANKSGMSKYLLGLYLYAIKKQPEIEQFGLLELAGKYTNTSGLCSYEKFGFSYNQYLMDDCFNDDNNENLPMIVNLENYSENKIFQIIKDEIKLPKDKICNVKDQKIQQMIGVYKNIYNLLEYQTDDDKLTYQLYSNQNSNNYYEFIKHMFNEFNQPETVDRTELMRYVKEYISHLYSQV
jgi:hypothetical protein